VLIYPVERARQRLRALWRLRRALDQAADGMMDEFYYDGIVCVQRAQITADLQRAAEDTGVSTSPVLRMTDQFLAQLNATDFVEATAIHDAIRELSEGDDSGETHCTRAIGSGLALKYAVNHPRTEILLQEIVRTGERNNG
jgi:hypothetical protein